jgi:hypothetical protein
MCVTGNITSTGQIIAQTINVQQVTSSIVYSCGSNTFGCSLTNNQVFTGSILATGSLTLNGPMIGSSTACFGGNITTSGCIGIGTPTAATPLHIVTAGLPTIRLTLGSEARCHNINGVNLGRDLQVLPFRHFSVQAGNGIAEGQITLNAYEDFIVGTGASYTPRLTILSGGTVAIGTTGITDSYTATGGGWQTVQFGKGGVLGAYRTDNESMTGFNTYTSAPDGANKAIISNIGGTAIRYYEDRMTFNTLSTSGTAQTQCERMRINTDGSILVGATNADVGGSVKGAIIRQNGSIVGATNISSPLHYQSPIAADRMNTQGDGLMYGMWRQGIFQAGIGATNGSVMTFFTGNNDSMTERLRITSGGNILVGYNQTTTTTIGRTFATVHSSANRGAKLFYGIDDGSNGGMFVYNVAAAVGAFNSQYISFETHEGGVSAGERMRITSGGDTELVKTGIAGITNSTSNTLRFRNTQTNDQSVILGTIFTTSPGSWGGDMIFTTHPSNSSPDDSTTERMRITSGGRTLLLGSSSSGWSDSNRALLELNHTGSALLGLRINGDQRAYFYHNNSHLYIENMLAGGSIYVISNSGGVYLTSGGTSWTSNSDERLKNINGSIENAVDKLMTLRTVNYSWKNDQNQKQNLGLIAQDVEKVFPQVIDINKLPSKPNHEKQDNTEYLCVRNQELIPVLVKAIQEQQTQIESIKAENGTLKSCLGIM